MPWGWRAFSKVSPGSCFIAHGMPKTFRIAGVLRYHIYLVADSVLMASHVDGLSSCPQPLA